MEALRVVEFRRGASKPQRAELGAAQLAVLQRVERKASIAYFISVIDL